MKPATTRSIIPVLLLLLVSLPVLAQDREVAQVYAAEAVQLYRSGDFARASDLARRGLEFMPGNSDLLVIRARASARMPSATSEAIDFYLAAIDADRYSIFDSIETRAQAADLLNRTGRHREALVVIDGALIDPLFNRDLLYQQARALFGLGRTRTAEERASAGIRVYLDDPRFFRLLLERVPVPGYRDYLSVRRYESQSSDYLDLLLLYLRRVPDSSHRTDAALRYFELGGSDPAASVLLLSSSSNPEAEFARFRRLGGANRHDLLVEVFGSMDAATQTELKDEFSSFTGVLTVDQGRDGIVEQRLIFEHGGLIQWSIDTNSDGVPEFLIEFDGRTPRRVEHTGAGGYSLIEYGDYPEVRAATIDGNGGDRSVYHVIGDRFEVLLVSPEFVAPAETGDGTPIPDALRAIALHETFTIVDRDAIGGVSGFVEFFRADARRAHRIVELDGGLPLRSVEDTNGDGAVDHIVRYSGGVRSEGMRDINGDGRFEVIERYRDDRLFGIMVAGEPDGIIEYYQEFGEVETFGWDLDRDGTIDVRERYLADLLILREYATKPDGVFDLSIEFFSDILSIRDE